MIRTEGQLQGLIQAASGYHNVLAENRRLYNEVQDLKGKVKSESLFLRVKISRFRSVEISSPHLADINVLCRQYSRLL